MTSEVADKLIFDAQLIDERDYWTARLSETLDASNLPLDYVRTVDGPVRREFVQWRISGETHRNLVALTSGSPFLVYVSLMSAVKVCIHKYTGSRSIVVGSPAYLNGEQANGNANAVAIVDDVDDTLSGQDLLLRIRETLLEAYSKQRYPFPRLAKDVGIEQHVNRCPFFDVALAMEGIHSKLPDLKTDLTIQFLPGEEELCGTIEFNSNLFRRDSITRFATHLTNALEAIVSAPQRLMSELMLLDKSERNRVLKLGRGETAEENQELCVHQLFEQQARCTPHAVATVYEEGQLTYGELNRRSNRLARHILKLNMGTDATVGICMQRSLDLVITAMGILKAGAAFVPIDPSHPPQRLEHMLSDAGVTLLLTQEPLLDAIPEFKGRVICIDAEKEAIDKERSQNPDSGVSVDNLAYVIYTSGSTGQSKGVMVTHGGWASAFQAWENGYQLTAVISTHLQMASFAFDVFAGDLARALGSGAKLVLCPRESLLEPDQLYLLMRQQQVDCAEFVPAVLRSLVPYLQENGQLLDFMRVLVVGSDCWYRAEHREVEGLCGSQTRFINSYGTTETTIDSSFFESAQAQDHQGNGLVPIGRPLANTTTQMLDSRLQPLPIGVPGELCIGGMGVARGYLDRPELTAERFTPDPFSRQHGARLYKTGDLARWLVDGNIEFLGRKDHQVKIRGFRVELEEIESCLAQHPSVRETVVMARPVSGQQDENMLAAYVVIEQNGKSIVGQLRAHLRDMLPDYMIPAAFVTMDKFPLTASGKVNRRALPAPDPTRPDLEENYVAPRNSTEETAAEVWKQLLPVEQVGVHDNFFELGGHSLLATQVVSRLRKAFQVELPLAQLFIKPTVAGIAETILELRESGQGLQAPPMTPVPRDQELPLSFAQERLWFIDQLIPNSSLYHIPAIWPLEGPLNLPALQRTFNEIVRRHETLRTSFPAVDGRPIQLIAPPREMNVPIVDLRALPPAARGAAVASLEQEGDLPFDLAHGPMLRIALVRLSDDEYVLAMTMHHIISDGWSMGVVGREVAALYEAFSEDRPSPLSELPIQYADFAAWQRGWLKDEVLEQQLDYWKQQLDGAPAVLELPTDRPRPAIQSHRGAYRSFVVSKSATDKLMLLSRAEGATLFMTVLAAFQTLLARYSARDDISVGTPIANRNRAEIEGLIGFFVNTLVIRSDLSGKPTFRELLRRVRQVTLGGYDHQDLPFEKLVEALRPQRDMSHTPLFQVMFQLDAGERNARASEDVADNDREALQENTERRGQPSQHQPVTAKFDMTLSLNESGRGLSGGVEYSTDLFDSATIDRLVEHFLTLVEAIVANPDQAIHDLPLLTEPEQQQLLVEWNNTSTDYQLEACIHKLFEVQVQRSPDSVAVAFDGDQITYQQLNQRANQLAHYLQRFGIGPDVLVGISVDRSLDMVVGILGILKAGGAYVPLDPKYPEQRLEYMIADAQVPVLLTQRCLLAGLPENGANVLCLDADWDQIGGQPTKNLEIEVSERNLAYMIYTSGSTGNPKGVLISHRAIARHCQTIRQHFELNPEDRVLQSTSLSFDVAYEQILPCLTTGAVLVLLSVDAADPREMCRSIAELGLTIINMPPAFWHQLTEAFAESAEQYFPSQLRLTVVGGDVMPRDSLRLWLGSPLKTVRLLNAYGPTETTITTTTYEIQPDADNASPLTSVSIGRPLDNRSNYILDKHGNPVPVGVTGELCIGGDGLARGYLKHPELTAERFMPDRFSNNPVARLYKTGDLVRYSRNGDIEFLGRIDHQVKIRGYRIELGEIESVLIQHAAVQEVVVETQEYVSADRRLVAYVVAATENEALAARDLLIFLRGRLPAYMIPSAFVILDKLPLTPNGKLDRRALPLPNDARPDLAQTYVAPRDATEEILAEVCARLLGLERVGIHDNFFDLGGHSLLATQVVSRLRQAFQVELPLVQLFESPTVAGLSESIQALRESDQRQAPPTTSASRDQELPLSFAQERLWFIDQLVPDSSLYHMAATWPLPGPLDLSALQRTFNEIVRRHETLRTFFPAVDGRPTQVIAPARKMAVPIVDLRELPPAGRAAVASRLEQEGNQPFDLAHGPLLRVVLVRLEDDEYVLAMTMHHIISDGWSMGVVDREVAALYEAFSAGRPSPLPELPIQYADFALRQRRWLQGKVLQQQVDYWRQQLDGAPAVLEFPTDRPRPATQSHRGAYRSVAISKSVTEKLMALSHEEGATLFMTLLAAFKTLLYRYSGQEDIVVGSPIANRNRVEIEGLIGFFVNSLVMRSNLSGNPSFRELLRRVRQVALGAYEHQDLPFEKLVAELQPQRDMSHSPLFQVMFILQNAGQLAVAPNASSEEDTDDSESSQDNSDPRGQPPRHESGTAKFDMALRLTEISQGLAGSLEYSTDLFDAATIDRLVERFQILVEEIAADPDQTIHELPLVTELERRQLLVPKRDGGPDVVELRTFESEQAMRSLHIEQSQAERAPRSIICRFEEIVDAHADEVAIRRGQSRLRYAELEARANRLANLLIDRGARPGAVVAIVTENRVELITAMLATLKAGCAFVPLDPTTPPKRLEGMVRQVSPDWFVVQPQTLDQIASAVVAADLCCNLVCLGEDQLADEQGLEVIYLLDHDTCCRRPRIEIDEDDLVYVYFTSGSTGTPKAIAGRRKGLDHFIDWEIEKFDVAVGTRVSQLTPPTFDPFLRDIFVPLCAGGTICLPDGTDTLPDGRKLIEWIDGQEINLMHMVPSVFRLILNEQLDADRLSSLRYLLLAGETLLPSDVRRWTEVYGTQVQLVNLFGPTETTMAKFCYFVQPSDQHRRSVPIGKPMPGSAAIVLDAMGRPCPTGVSGEIHIRTPYRSLGYYKQPELTEAVFVANPWSDDPDDLLYKTGDLGRVGDDGTFEFLGREDHQVKIRGMRVELGEIETMLRDHAEIQDAVVTEQVVGSGNRILCAYVVAIQPIETRALSEHLSCYLPGYMIPSNFTFLEALPLTSNGKVNRRALPAPELEQNYVAPRNAVEKTVAEVYARILGLERVGIHDNFFELGGHSLLATQVVSRIRQALDVEFPLAQLFDRPTVAGLAKIIQQLGKTRKVMDAPAFTGVERDQELPLTSSGEVNRRALPAAELAQSYVAPRNAVEETVADVYAAILGLERASIHDNFFELGGHSLLAAQVVARIRQALDVDLPLGRLFSKPTVAGLAETIQELCKTSKVMHLPAITRFARDQELPLSFAQERLWFLDQLMPNSTVYHMAATWPLPGPLNLSALQRTFNEVMRRHEALRTSFPAMEGRPTQVIAPPRSMTVPTVDLRALSPDALGVAISKLSREGNQPFDLGHGPLLRIALVRLSDDEYVLAMTMHHIISDGWSMEVVGREVAALYEAFSAGYPSPLPELPIQYADFAAWQRGWLKDEALQQRLDYWRQQLDGAPAVLELPTDRPRPAIQSYRGAYRSVAISKSVTDKLMALSHEEGATLFMTLLAAFKTLLCRYAGQEDIVVGAPIANRNHAEIEGLIGFFVNTLAIRSDLSGNPSFREIMRRVRQVALGAYEHQDLPFEKLVEELQPQRDMSHTPLFQVMFVFQNADQLAVTSSASSDENVDRERDSRPDNSDPDSQPSQHLSGTAKFDMTLTLAETGEGLAGSLEYRTDLFDAATIDRLAEHFQVLVAGIAVDPDQTLYELPLLTEAERQQLLVEWNDTATDYPQEVCVHRLFESQVQKSPDSIAVVFDNEQLTYRQLNGRANELAHFLQTRGVESDVLVGLCVERSLEMVVGILGILKAGGAYVPLDPEYPQERLDFMLEDANTRIVVTQKKWKGSFPTKGVTTVCLDSDWEQIAGGHNYDPVVPITTNHLAYVIYTSGSTGKPKGTLITHRGLNNQMRFLMTAYDLTTADSVLQKTTLSFDISVNELYPPLLSGARLIIAQPGGQRDAAYLVDTITKHEVTTIDLVPYSLQMLLQERGVDKCRSLKQVWCGGDVLPVELQDAFHERLTADLVNMYGPTETTVTVMHWRCRRGSLGTNIPIGRPMANTQVYVLDHLLQPMPAGVAGELYVGGVQLARGYLNRRERTAESFIPNPFTDEPGERLYRTGDLARYLKDGNIEFLGRIDFQVKVRGFRIELGEIQATLQEHPAVRHSLVLAREDVPDDKRLVAYLVADADVVPSAGTLREFLKRQLPMYMVPSAFVMLDKLPLTPSGKVNRAALPEPSPSRPGVNDTFAGPRNAIERTVATTWADLLRLERVGIHDNFFDLGGHSLTAVEAASKTSTALGANISVRMLFQHPTVASLFDALQLDSSPEPSGQTAVIQPIQDTQTVGAASRSRSTHTKPDEYSLLQAIIDGKAAPIDSAALGYLGDYDQGSSRLSRDELLRDICDNRPFLSNVRETSLGRIGVIILPRFQSELYDSEDALVQEVLEALELAGRIGASTVSLTGLIPSATDYGHAIAKKMNGRGELPVVTTGHGTTVASVVLAIETILRSCDRHLENETVAFLGLGSIGQASLHLMLRSLPHPPAIILADVYSKLSQLETIRQGLEDNLGYQGTVRILDTKLEIPDEFYQSTLVVGATNVPSILDVSRLQPGTLLVDDSGPHCFDAADAIRRLEKGRDILFTEGGVLKSPQAIHNTWQLSGQTWFGRTTQCRRVQNVTGCVLSGLLSTRFEDLVPTLGLIDDETALRNLERLRTLGFEAARLHCGGYRLSKAAVRGFRRRFGADKLKLQARALPDSEHREFKGASDVPSTSLSTSDGRKARQAVNGEDVSSSLVPIRTGGSCTPFFCVHPAIGSAVCFVDLARQLGSDQPFYGLQSRGLVEGQRPHKSIEEMAAHYIEAIRTVRPQGPYQLGGWSLGGVVVFEMARQLVAQGEKISLLALLDSYGLQLRDEVDEVAELISFGLHLGLPTDDQALRREHLGPLSTDERLHCVLERARRANRLPADCGISYIRRLFDVHQSNIEANRVYVPARYPGRATLFRASEDVQERWRISALGWRKLSAGGVAIHVVPGDHYTMLQVPNVSVLAKQLRQCLDEAGK